jgi:hypothetical protein
MSRLRAWVSTVVMGVFLVCGGWTVGSFVGRLLSPTAYPETNAYTPTSLCAYTARVAAADERYLRADLRMLEAAVQHPARVRSLEARLIAVRGTTPNLSVCQGATR